MLVGFMFWIMKVKKWTRLQAAEMKASRFVKGCGEIDRTGNDIRATGWFSLRKK
jgi:hypothetical protein